MPFRADTFDVVWGQDARCYITDKWRLLKECARVIRPGGIVAFTDWLETSPMTDEEWMALYVFMVFPYMETLDGYASLAEADRLTVVEKEDLSPDFAEHVPVYLSMVQNQYKQGIPDGYGQEIFDQVVNGLLLGRDAAVASKVSRRRIKARKPAAPCRPCSTGLRHTVPARLAHGASRRTAPLHLTRLRDQHRTHQP